MPWNQFAKIKTKCCIGTSLPVCVAVFENRVAAHEKQNTEVHSVIPYYEAAMNWGERTICDWKVRIAAIPVGMTGKLLFEVMTKMKIRTMRMIMVL